MRVSGAPVSRGNTRSRFILWTFALLISVFSVLPALTANAALITGRSLTLEPNGSNGASEAGVASNHHYEFTVTTLAGIRSIKFQYCTAADPATCSANPPAGLSASSGPATLGATVGLGGSPAINTGDADAPYVSFSSDLTQANIEVTLTGVVNPTANNETFYVYVTTHTASNGTGAAVDAGFVAASTAEPIVLNGTMPEALTFCTGATVPTTGGSPDVPDCSAATSGDIDFTTLFSESATSTATSQMAASTNAADGYVITVQGATMTNGSATIPAIGGVAETVTVGEGQFGMNLVDNTTPNVGTTLSTGHLTGGVYNGTVAAPFATADNFAFTAGTAQTVANSNTDVSDLQIFTVSYIVNVSGSQAAGDYTTTLTYVCTPTY